MTKPSPSTNSFIQPKQEPVVGNPSDSFTSSIDHPYFGRQLVDQSTDSILVANEEGLIIEWNHSSEIMFGIQRAEAIGKPLWEIQYCLAPDETRDPALLKQLKDMVQTVCQTGGIPEKIHGSQMPFLHPDGSSHTCETFMFPIKTDKGYLACCISRDITDRRKTEDDLRRERDMIANIAETSPVGITRMDNNGQIVFANLRAEQILGLDKESITRLDFSAPDWHITDFKGNPLPPEELPFHRVKTTSLAVYGYQHAIHWPNGRRIFLSINAVPIFDRQGRFDGVVASIEDISRKVEIENALRHSEERYHQLFSEMLDGFALHEIVCDPSGHPCDYRFLEINPAFERLTGLKRSDILGQNVTTIIPGIERHWIERYARVALTGEPVYFEDSLPSLNQVFNVTAFSPKPGQFATIFTDVTERLKSEEKIRHLATFPEYNPNPVLELDMQANLLFYNEAAQSVLHKSRLENQYELYFPGNLKFILQQFQQGKMERASCEIDLGDATLQEDITYIPKLNLVRIYCHDITDRRLADQRTQVQLHRLASLREIDTAITASLNLKFVLNVFLEQVTGQLGVDAATVLLLNPITHSLDFAAGRGFRSVRFEHNVINLFEGINGRIQPDTRITAARNFVSTSALGSSPLFSDEGFCSYHGTPLIAKGVVKGVLEIFQRTSLQPEQEWVDFFDTLAGQAAIAIDNAELFENLQRNNLELSQAYDATIEGWSRALDLRDHETEGHTRRVCDVTVDLANYMNLNSSQFIHLRRGALLHDIGKMAIPDIILLKPGPLTDSEWEIMRMHPTRAFELLSPISFLRPAIDIPYCHHERWDGSGYPRGLKGEMIPLGARIFALVDVWDALSSDRPYRKGWRTEQVRQYINDQSGKHFDPNVVAAFNQLKPEK